jgi:hypothetical protein
LGEIAPLVAKGQHVAVPPETPSINEMADSLILGSLLASVRANWGEYRILDHWQQGEFHHDLVLELGSATGLPGPILVVSTNCNGGVKEVLCLADRPDRGGLWRARCPENADFVGPIPTILAAARTTLWFDPGELLVATARSEYKEAHRERQSGGGWMLRRGLT